MHPEQKRCKLSFLYAYLHHMSAACVAPDALHAYTAKYVVRSTAKPQAIDKAGQLHSGCIAEALTHGISVGALFNLMNIMCHPSLVCNKILTVCS